MAGFCLLRWRTAKSVKNPSKPPPSDYNNPSFSGARTAILPSLRVSASGLPVIRSASSLRTMPREIGTLRQWLHRLSRRRLRPTPTPASDSGVSVAIVHSSAVRKMWHEYFPRYFRAVIPLDGAGAKCARPSSISHLSPCWLAT
jgi:hypothetical protein